MTAGILAPLASSTLDLPPGSYIYSVLGRSGAYAVISSDDSLRLFDGATLRLQPGGVVKRTHAGVTCLRAFDEEGNVWVTAGRDGFVRCWDLRAGKKATEIRSGNGAPLLSLDCSPRRRTIVTGSELHMSQASVLLWDVRNPTKPQLQYVESHNDDITEVEYHPTEANLLLSGSTDGLVNIYDTTISDEDDALYQVINHRSSIHHAGFLGDMDVVALSHDETLSVHRLADPNENTEEPSPTVFGDLREKLNCEYVVGVVQSSKGVLVGAGRHSDHRLDLVPLKPGQQWSFDQNSSWRIDGAHDEEIIRTFCIDDTSHVVYTAGEDGCVRVWKAPEPTGITVNEEVETKAPKRFRPPVLLRRAWRALSLHLPPLNFITLHYAYFIGVSLVSSIILWSSSTPSHSVSYVDSLFLTVSAMSLAGLNTINLSLLNTFQQIILFLLIMLGSAILISSAVVHVRRKAFEKRFQSIIEEQRRKKGKRRNSSERRSSFPLSLIKSVSLARRRPASQDLPAPEVDGVVVRGRSITANTNHDTELANGNTFGGHRVDLNDGNGLQATVRATASQEAKYLTGEGGEDSEATKADRQLKSEDHVHFVDGTTYNLPVSPTRSRGHSRLLSMQGVGARPDTMNYPRRRSISQATGVSLERGAPQNEAEHNSNYKYYPRKGFIGRNSQFHSLTLAERERLGGVEYKAVTLLALIVPIYFVLWQLFGSLGLGAYIANYRADTTLQNGLNPWWVGAFNAVSAFNNSGMSLLDANMVAFQDSVYILITMGLLILAGNTAYPLFLRLIIWSFKKLMPNTTACRDHIITLNFLLDHPRRCYTNLFPSAHTWWLLGSIVMLNGIDWAAFEILNIGNDPITSLPRGTRVLDGLFQALAVRSGGFYVVSIAQLRIGLLVLYVVMMYISVYPVVITMRNSNVYEERSLGIYADDPTEKDQASDSSFFKGMKHRLTARGSPKEPRGYFIRQQLRAQIAHDIWILVLAVIFITIIETGQFVADPVAYSVFNILFEVVSAYGTVGISVGLPNVAYSFCGGWHSLSKLILCLVMIRGRHRGLPVAIDRAVLLPGEHLAAAEEEDAQIRLERTMSKGHWV